jgi:glycerate kinase
VAADEAATPQRVLVCPQEFKGSLTAAEAAEALASGVREALPDAEVRELPMADGGPGTVAIVAAASAAEVRSVEVSGPLGTPVTAAYGFDAASGVATLEASAAAGLLLVAEGERQPLRASTRGVGELVAAALAEGAREVVLGVGGTGTNDSGAGAAQALGLRLLGLVRVERGEATRGLEGAQVRIAVDVTNPLLGERGATSVYGPQKGVTDWQAPALEECLSQFAAIVERDLGIDVRDLEGAGAGGGLPSGVLAAVRAAGGACAIESGAALVAERVGLREAIEWSDLVVTGEGSMDAQSAYGKSTAHAAALALEAGRRCVAVAGSVEGTPPGVEGAVALVELARDLDDAMARAADLATEAGRRVVAI